MRCFYLGSHRIVRNRKDTRFDTHCLGHTLNGLAKAQAGSQQVCAGKVGCEVLVSEAKPAGHSKRFDRFKALECLVGQTPASNRIESARKRIRYGIDIGADVQTPNICIVTYVYNDVNL